MNRDFVDSVEFKNKDFTKKILETADYEYCNFVNCDFTDTDLSKTALWNANLTIVILAWLNYTERPLRI